MSEVNWVVETVILLGSSASCFSDKLYFPHFDVVCLVGSTVGSFVGLLIGSTNRIQWFTRTRFPAAELRFMKASPEFVKRKIAKSTKNLERAVSAVQFFRFFTVYQTHVFAKLHKQNKNWLRLKNLIEALKSKRIELQWQLFPQAYDVAPASISCHRRHCHIQRSALIVMSINSKTSFHLCKDFRIFCISERMFWNWQTWQSTQSFECGDNNDDKK